MSDTTALGRWGKGAKETNEDGGKATERDISGGEPSSFEDSLPFGPEDEDLHAERAPDEHGEAPAGVGQGKKNRQLMVVCGAVLALVLGGVAYKRSSNNSQQLQLQGGQDAIAEVQAPVAPVAQPLVVDQPEAAASSPSAASPPATVSPPVFGATASAPPHLAAVHVQPTAPAQMQQAAPGADQTARIAELTARLNASESSQRQANDLLLAEIRSLKNQLAGVAEAAKNKPAPARAVQAPAQATPKPVPAPVKKEAEVPPQTAEAQQKPTQQAEPKQAPQPIKGKVRTDYRIYAVVEGRVWVRSLDSQSEAEVVDLRSRLADGSSVVEIRGNEKLGIDFVVMTSKGEIR